MTKKKIIELVQEIQSPNALIIDGAETSSFLASTLKDQGCEVSTIDSYSPTSNKFDYIFLFDNLSLSDEIYEKNLLGNGKFILIQTTDEILSQSFSHPRFKIIKIGDPTLWSLPQLANKILRTLFSSTGNIIDLHRKPTVSAKIKKENIPQEKEESTKIEHNDLPMKRTEINKSYKPIPPILEKKHRFNFKKIFSLAIFIFLGLLIIFAGIGYMYLSSLQKTFANLEYHLKSSNITLLRSDLTEAEQEVKTIRNTYEFLSIILFPFKNSSYMQDFALLLDSSEQLFASAQDLSLTVVNIMPNKSGFGQVTENLSRENLIILEKKVENFTSILYKSQANIEKVTLPYFPKERIKTALSPILSQLTAAYEILPTAEKIFFADGTKVYLVLLQNNMELRPTGGFIGSYGLLTISSGKIVNFKIEDVYTADGQLKGHVDPPPAIRKYLSQPHFFLRDSNFDPDFAASAVQASWFLQKELGKDVDGVIALNLTLAQKLMQVVGSIKLSDFGNEEITSANFFSQVNYFSQDNFFPGSTQKKDILTGITNEIMTKMTGDGQINYGQLLPIIKQSLEQKNILFYFKGETLQKFVEDHGWAGRMAKVQCVVMKNAFGKQSASNTNSCLPDYLSIIEANLGVNKANYFINKSTIIEKKITADGQLSTTVTLSYENQNNITFRNPLTYVNYLRFFVPVPSKLVSVSLNNAPLSPVDIDTDTYADDKTVFGFLVKIASGNKGVVKITYLQSFKLESLSSYQLFYQKQAGDKNAPLVFTLVSPGISFKPVNFVTNLPRDHELYYTTDTSVDRIFELKRD